MALVKAGRLNEAETYLREMLRQDPNSGPANLGLGRILLQQGATSPVIAAFHHAIYGSWPKDAQASRIAARLELIAALGKVGAKRQAQAELLALSAETPDDPGMQKQVGHLLLQFGFSSDAADIFRKVLQKEKSDAMAYDGLGEAELALGDFSSAQSAVRRAVRIAPGNGDYEKRLQLADQVIAIDPAISGLHAADRFEVSLKLLEASVGVLDQCLAGARTPVAEDVRSLADEGRKALLRHKRPASYSDAADSNIALAKRMWGERNRICGAATPAEEPLSRVMGQLTR